MSFVSRLWNAIRNPVRYVGRDLEGNRFYEAPGTNDPERTKRTVQYSDSQDVWKYVGGGKRLPIQWSAWLTHTRPHPPTLQELKADMERQQRVLMNAAMIEAKDREERALRLLPHSLASQSKETESSAKTAHDSEEVPSLSPRNDKSISASQSSLAQETPRSPWKLNSDPEPESWSPRTIRRGS